MQEPQKKNLKTGLMKHLRPLLARAPYARGEELLLSVSGGMDSMVLLDVMIRMAHVHGTPVRVLHVHHHTGSHADDACNLVKQFCKSHAVPLRLEHFHWNESGNFEYEASSFRRYALETERAERGWVVLAHHQRDQAETLIQTLVRGAGPATPLGMSPQRDRRLRPFLEVPYHLLVEHARRALVPFVSDPTNEDPSRFRNAIRQRVLPVLDSFHGGVDARLSHWAEEYRRLQQGLMRNAHTFFGAYYRHGLLQREVFATCSDYLWDYLLALFWEVNHLPKPKSKEHRRLIAWLNDGRCAVFEHGGYRCFCDLDGLILWPASEPEPRPYCLGDTVSWGFGTLCIEQVEPGFFGTASVFLSPAGTQAVSRKIRERLREARVPHRIRGSLPVLSLDGRSHHFLELLDLEEQGRLRIFLTHGSGTEPIHFPRPRLPRPEPI